MPRSQVVAVAKAAPVDKYDSVPDVQINIVERFPNISTLAETGTFARTQAKIIEQALYDSLPGCTYDWLLGCMMERKTSHLHVAYGERREVQNAS